MSRLVAVLVLFLSTSNGFSDTFVNRATGETFNGYATNFKKGFENQVRIGASQPKYLNLDNYKITPNNKGRKERIYDYSLQAPLNLFLEANVLEESMPLVANQGPYFIILELDSPYGEIEIARKIADCIKKIDYCKTVCWIRNDKYGGAFGAAATAALACDEVYISKNASIGAAPVQLKDSQISPSTGEQKLNKWTVYSASIAKSNGRNPLFVRAMFDSEIEISEFIVDSNSVLVETTEKNPKLQAHKIWTEKGTLLRLNADDAERFNIVDGIVDSRLDIIKKLNAENCRLLKDRKLASARRKLKSAQRELKSLNSVIQMRKPNIQDTEEQLRRIEQDIQKARDIIYRSRYNRDIGSRILRPNRRVTLQELEDMILYRDDVLEDLTNMLESQLRDSRKAVSLSKEFIDLKKYVQSENISETLEETKAQLNEATYWPKYQR